MSQLSDALDLLGQVSESEINAEIDDLNRQIETITECRIVPLKLKRERLLLLRAGVASKASAATTPTPQVAAAPVANSTTSSFSLAARSRSHC